MAGRRGEAPSKIADPVPAEEAPPEPDEAQPPPGVVLDEDGPLFPDGTPIEATESEQEALVRAAAELAAQEAPESGTDEAALTTLAEVDDAIYSDERVESGLSGAEAAVMAGGVPWEPFVGAHLVYVLTRDDALRIEGGQAMGQPVLAIVAGINPDEGGGLSLWLFPDNGDMILVRGVLLTPEPSEVGPIHAGKAFRVRQLTL